jgi:replicative DNA helicase
MNAHDSEICAPIDALDPFRQAYNAFTAHYDNKGLLSGYATGFIDLDQRLGGLQKGDLILITGEPSIGKTTFASNIACHVAISNNLPVQFFTLETKAFKLAWRMLIATGRIHSAAINSGKPLDDDWSRLTMAIRLLCANKKVQIIDSLQSIAEITAYVRSDDKSNGIGMVVIDCLQLAIELAEAADYLTMVEKLLAQLKILAMELDIPIVLIANTLSIFAANIPHVDVHLDLSKTDKSTDNYVEICATKVGILKTRNSKAGDSQLLFLKNYFRFDNLANNNIQSDNHV